MFEAIKRLFGRSEKQGNAPEVPAAPVREPARPPRAQAPQPGRTAPAAAPPAPAPAPTAASGELLRVSLKGVMGKMPDKLKARIRSNANASVYFSIPLASVLKQLPTGRVQISFGDLRKSVPAGVIGDAPDQDATLLEIALSEILPQLRPDQLPRRSDQKKVEVPDEVAPVFGRPGGQGPRIVTKEKPAASAAAPAPGAVVPKAPYRSAAPQPAAPAPIPAPSVPPPAKGPAAVVFKKPEAEAKPIAAKAPQPVAPVTPAPIKPVAAPAPLPKLAPPPPPPAPAPAQAAAGPADAIVVPVAAVLASVPDALKSALSKSPDAVFALPAAELEKALKSGKAVFTWRQLRSCIRPPLITSTTPAADEVAVEFPLAIIAPIFMQARKPAAPQKKVVIDAEIPDVFGGGRVPGVQPRGGPAPSPAAVPAPAPVAPKPAPAAPRPVIPIKPIAPITPIAPMPSAAPAAAPMVPVLATPPPAVPKPAAPRDVGEIFGQPGRKNWTPAEIVQKTSQLPGVAGALIVLQDGLLVASQLPPSLNAETVAAFIPQMYSRMTQYFKELKFGEPGKLAFIIENVPLKLYRGAGVYFTILGRADEPLPDDHLDVIAAQLGSSK